MELQVNRIQKQYGKKAVLRDVSFTAKSGQCVGFLGENGSGKSTLFGVLAGLIRGEGSFLLDGEDLLKDERLRQKTVGFVPQSPPLMAELTARDNLLLWYDKKSLEQQLREGSLGMLGIGEFLNLPVRKLSGGMKKRLAIGCAMAQNPRILLLDEPTSALDLVCKESIYRHLRKFEDEGGIVLLATHDVYELQLCDTIHVLKDGVLQAYEGRRLADDFIGCLRHE